MTEKEWIIVKTHMMELSIPIENINSLQEKLLAKDEEETDGMTVQEYLRDTEAHILSEQKYYTDDQLLDILKDHNINSNHLQYLKIALEAYE